MHSDRGEYCALKHFCLRAQYLIDPWNVSFFGGIEIYTRIEVPQEHIQFILAYE
ncbi:hypothetical protein KDI_50190 [Dictyobacter arantiisoli]|uniref:Uncharacterized protein n=1 Tax=Dictyobacter arantiisoli TaxID=2014874 RepID=A0A5A5TJM8_9CHLR|nr:hypothetical protein KDI_50190 [Dictyobacter arantiisoli]